jgi:hypothetical protein
MSPRVRRRWAVVRQRWTLAAMERKLRVSEPKLIAMFTMFTWLVSDEAPSAAEAVSRHYRRRRRSRLWPYALVACVTVALVGLGVGLSTSGSPSCTSSGLTPPGGGTSPAYATCRLPPQRVALPQPAGH